MMRRVPMLMALVCVRISSAAAGAECGCEHAAALQARINMAHRAIEEYQAQLQVMRDTDMTGGKAPGSKKTNRDLLQAEVRLAQAAVQNVMTPLGTGETLVTCKKTVKANSCLALVVDAHEQFHVARCEADKKRLKLGTFDDRWARRPLKDYAKEEIAGYEIEIAESVKRLSALPASCRPSGWVGTIRVLEIENMTGTTVTPPPEGHNYSDPTTETFNHQMNRSGTVWYSNKPTAYWDTQVKSKKHTVSGRLESCIGGLKPVPPDKHRVDTVESGIEGTGRSTKTPDVSVTVADDGSTYSIWLVVPSVPGRVRATGYTKSVGGCDDTNLPVPQGPTMPSQVKGLEPINIERAMKPKDRYLSGSEAIDLIPFKVTIPGAPSVSDEIRVYWHLHLY